MKKIFTLCNESAGDHIGCFETETQALEHATEAGMTEYSVEEEDFDPECNCEFL